MGVRGALGGEAKVGQLDGGSRRLVTQQQVLGLERKTRKFRRTRKFGTKEKQKKKKKGTNLDVAVNEARVVHVFNGLEGLQHGLRSVLLREATKLDDAIEQLATRNPTQHQQQ